jgi:hypothetical protein
MRGRMYLSPAQPRIPEVRPRLACPAPVPHYVIPGSHRLDPPYSWQNDPTIPSWWQGRWPWPRIPWPFESESRARGSGLITPSCRPPPALPPCKPLYWPPGNRGC